MRRAIRAIRETDRWFDEHSYIFGGLGPAKYLCPGLGQVLAMAVVLTGLTTRDKETRYSLFITEAACVRNADDDKVIHLYSGKELVYVVPHKYYTELEDQGVNAGSMRTGDRVAVHRTIEFRASTVAACYVGSNPP